MKIHHVELKKVANLHFSQELPFSIMHFYLITKEKDWVYKKHRLQKVIKTMLQ